ncbi:hypothetical protein [Streptomyces sp. NPDC127098]|uniref:hypothetical protein n=1 Tax=Streptomyces sp. NPDC127098 TaxID=3347137 RepID=UPI0036545671
MSPDTGVRWTGHALMGLLVEDPATGRVGRLAAVLEHVDRPGNRVVLAEAHVRPVDGSGIEWTADAAKLRAVADGS